ncbi:hypothetical protein F5Y01DRAFT_140281 [Xylaria sp. FL0043]|nr:hypothetical protein F5Y01DRAFT_140281 [Xylaria sp. FL0043]
MGTGTGTDIGFLCLCLCLCRCRIYQPPTNSANMTCHALQRSGAEHNAKCQIPNNHRGRLPATDQAGFMWL